MEHKVTVIMPTYNGLSRGYLDKSLASIFAQTHKPMEVIVVDDGSTDGTPEFIRERFSQVQVLSQKNAGPSAARNLAQRRATGEFIAYLDDDDEWIPEKLARQVEHLVENPAFGFTGCGMIYIDEASRELERELPTPWGCSFPDAVLGNGFLPPSTLMFRKTLLDQVGDWNTGLRMGEDYELCYRCVKVAPMGQQMEYLTRYRRHGHQSCNDLSKIDRNTLQIISRLAEADFPDRSAAISRYYRYGAACRALIHRDFSHFRDMMSQENTRLFEFLLRMIGVLLAPVPSLKVKWRTWESRRLFS